MNLCRKYEYWLKNENGTHFYFDRTQIYLFNQFKKYLCFEISMLRNFHDPKNKGTS